MLNWDEEVEPSLKTPLPRDLPVSRSAGLPPSFFMPPAPLPADSAAPAKARRVKASDKRIINGQTDVNQLVPFKYKWAWENTLPHAPTTGCRRK